MNSIACVWLFALLTNLTPQAVPQTTALPRATASAPSKPAAPSGLTAKAGDAQVNLSWSAAPGATSYSVYRSSASNDGATRVAVGITAHAFVDKGVTNGTTYRYWVRASSAGAISDLSNGALATPQSPPPTSAPFVTVAAGNAEVVIEWTAVPHASAYRLFRATSGTWETTPLAEVTGTRYKNDGLTNGATYAYGVVAINGGGAGPFSNVIAAMPVAASASVTVERGAAMATDASASEAELPAANRTPSRGRGAEASPIAGDASGRSANSAPASMQGVQAGRRTLPQPRPATPVNQPPAAAEAVPAKSAPTPSSVPANSMATPSRPAPAAVVVPVAQAAPVAPAENTANTANTANAASAPNVMHRAGAIAASDQVVSSATGMQDPTSTASVTGTAVTNSGTIPGTITTNETAPTVDVRKPKGAGLQAPSDTAAAAPVAPINVTAAAGDRSVTLAWTLITGATSYNLYRSILPNQEVRVTVVGPLTPPYVDSQLANGVTYYYKLTAVNATGESAKSSEVSATPIAPPAAPDPATVAAFRFLRQATWGPKPGDVDIVKNIGVAAFLNQQFSTPASSYPDTLFNMPVDMAQERFMELALTGPDQLRQRVAWALHKIWVVSAVEVTTAPAIVTYHRLFLNDAFGNYRDLMTDITLNPAMGRYLNMLNNRSQAVTGSLPKENYARELMQLFTLGIPRLEGNGTPSIMLSRPGVPVIAYTEQDVKELARILTGWTFGDGNPATVPTNLAPENYKFPMEAVARFHDTGSKLFLETYFPPGQTARQELDHVLDVLFRRSNIGPFISRQLIQQLVTSNPSAAYVADVSAVFNGNGGSARGDLAAVVRAILTHPEAGVSTATSGKLSEPALFVASLMRALNASVTDHPFMSNAAEAMGQKVFFPASVFSYFSPGYRVRGTVGPAGLPLGGPEFQILTTVTALERANFVAGLLGGFYGMDVVVDYTPFTGQAANAQSLVDYCSLLFMGGRMSPEARQEIINAVATTAANRQSERVRTALYLTLTAAQFQVDR